MKPERRWFLQLVVSVVVGLSVIGIAFFNPYHLKLLERIILALIGVAVIVLF